ncbi:MAG: twin-arginine translocase subunit TatC [Haloarculaceae archaeon]
MAGSMDEDTRRAVASGRETLGAMLSSAQEDLQRVFMVFVAGFLLTFYALRTVVWDVLKADLNTNPHIEVVAVTPFDVILLQAKIALVVGVLVMLPVLVYYARDALRERDWWPGNRVSRLRLAVLGTVVVALFVLGVGYAYLLFFPIMLNFLASNAVGAGFDPTWSIVKWAQFIFLLSLSFGLAAQLPLAMSALAYAEIVPYETFRDKWRYAIVAIFVFGAVFSPPDPFTQVMWAIPLVGLYAFSLGLTKLVVQTKRSSESVDFRELARDRWNVLAGTALVVAVAVYLFFTRGGVAAVNDLLARMSARSLPTLGVATHLPNQVAAAIVAVLVAAVVTGVVLFYFATQRLDEAAARAARSSAGVGDPSAIDVDEIPADGVRAAPPEVFEAMSEDDAVEHAQRAVDEGDAEKARAILDRFDEVTGEEAAAESTGEEADGATDSGETDSATESGEETDGVAMEPVDGPPDEEPTTEEQSDVVTRTTAGVVDSFTEEETTEDDIGGYYTDIAFIVDSLTAKSFRLVAVFMAVMVATFGFLYYGGIGTIKNAFLGRMPPSMVPDVDIVTLHPVEALIFEIKFATLLAGVATVPVVLYYAWPALKERGFAAGDRRVLAVWGGTLIAALVGGSLVGFLYVAPFIISWLATDALQAHMVIAYRINNFGWLVVATTVGVGLLAEIPVTMVLFHRGGLVPYETMVERWRTVVIAIFVVSMLATPDDIFTMLIVAVPTSLAYLTGLGLLWVYTLGGRRTTTGQREPAD